MHRKNIFFLAIFSCAITFCEHFLNKFKTSFAKSSCTGLFNGKVILDTGKPWK